MLTTVQSNSSSNLKSTYTRSTTPFVPKSSRTPLDSAFSFGTRSRLEIGQFDRVFTTSGSVRRDFADVFRFSLNRSRDLRIYLGNRFSNPNSNNRRMVLNLIDDRTLRSITSTTVNPTAIGAIRRTLNPGTYRISISTQSTDRGRYFMDMVQL
jgi:hypothetical protein